MYDIRQFKPALYILILMGMCGFALAVNSAGILIVGCGAACFNAWLVRSGRFRPIPHWTSNLILLAGVPWVLLQSRGAEITDEVVWIGEYIVLLQIIKLYEQRGNRDYAQLLVLGLLLMVAAAINTASLAFGLLLLVYLFLSLYCCLLFYLKTEADTAKAALAIPTEKLNPATLRQDQRHLAASMRRITTLVAGVSIFFAVVVFLFCPRPTGEGLFGARRISSEQALTGFSTEVSFQQVARITQSNEIVAYVQVFKNDRQIKGNQTILLRGLTLERYHGDTPGTRRHKWEWDHVPEDEERYSTGPDRATELRESPAGGTVFWRQKVTLHPTGTNVLFAMAGPVSLSTHREIRVDYSPAAGNLRTTDVLSEPLDYEVISSNNLDPPLEAGASLPPPWQVDPQVLAFASLPEVCGSNARGPLAGQRTQTGLSVDPLDGEIAANFERYLRNHFTYTLDLTDAQRLAGRDPIVAFLYDLKRGHCEYFAGAMTLMCQSLGMQARMVVGFKCDEYNGVSGQYIVRQSHAHSWVEVRTAKGWKTFDPTSGTPADLAVRAKGGLWQSVVHLADFLEYSYASHIIAYDDEDRQNLLVSTESVLYRASTSSQTLLDQLGNMAQSIRFWNISIKVLAAVCWLMLAAMFLAFCWFLLDKWRLKRRALRIGINALPLAEQQRLARQLAFYDHLILMLERHHLTRPHFLTPLEFGESLLFLPSDVYDTINRLTKVFYRVRFGGAELSDGQCKRLETVLMHLNNGLSQAVAAN